MNNLLDRRKSINLQKVEIRSCRENNQTEVDVLKRQVKMYDLPFSPVLAEHSPGVSKYSKSLFLVKVQQANIFSISVHKVIILLTIEVTTQTTHTADEKKQSITSFWSDFLYKRSCIINLYWRPQTLMSSVNGEWNRSKMTE